MLEILISDVGRTPRGVPSGPADALVGLPRVSHRADSVMAAAGQGLPSRTLNGGKEFSFADGTACATTQGLPLEFGHFPARDGQAKACPTSATDSGGAGDYFAASKQ